MRHNWINIKLGDIAEIIMGQSPDGNSINDTVGIEFHQGKIAFGEKYLRPSQNYTTKPTKIAEEHSLLLCVRAPIGALNITERRICIGRGLCSIRAKEQTVLDFLYYALLSKQDFFEANASGSTFKAISTVIIKGTPILLPSLFEQQSIVAYLDEKTSQLDECIRLLELQKADLSDYRKAIISETVTRGLNPNAILKDSGIQWIGEIPKGWNIVPLKSIISFLTDGTHQTPNYVDEGVPFISIKDMSSGKLDFSDTKFISEEEHLLLSKHAPIEKGDILFSRIGTLGVFIKVDTDKVFDIFVSLGLMKIIPNTINTDYLVYYLSSSAIKKYIDIVKAGEGTSAAKFNLTDVRKTPILLPSASEQQAIVDYLDSKTIKIDKAIKKIDQQIADLRAYRTALISDVVTGKIDVRNN